MEITFRIFRFSHRVLSYIQMSSLSIILYSVEINDLMSAGIGLNGISGHLTRYSLIPKNFYFWSTQYLKWIYFWRLPQIFIFVFGYLHIFHRIPVSIEYFSSIYSTLHVCGHVRMYFCRTFLPFFAYSINLKFCTSPS